MDYDIVLPSRARIVSEEDFKATFEVDGLYPGYGHTLGNSLRRILLSSLPGAAVTKVKIEGVSHEFSTIEGVMEDVVTILLNIKQLRFKLHGDDPQTAAISVSGVKEAKGKDIKCPTQLEVMNKNHHIASLTDKKAKLEAEITVERGLGFVPAENLMKDKVAVGTLVLDAIFTPIRRANYEVENMRVGDRTDYNRLRLSIETDGTITPSEALKKAISIMRRQLEEIEKLEGESEGKEEAASSEKEYSLPSVGGFENMKLSQRTKNALFAAELKTADELSQKKEEELRELDGVGEKAISEIKKGLAKLGMSLKS